MKKLVSEEGSVMNYNKWVKGIADREFSAQKLMVNDLFNSKDNNQSPDTVRKHQNALPYPLGSLVSALGNSIVGLQNSLSIVESLKNSPLLRKEGNDALIGQSLKDLHAAAELIQKAAKCVDNIQISI